MKNQLSKILFIAGLAVMVQACKKESITTIDSKSKSETPQSIQLPNDQNTTKAKEIDMTDLAGASTPYNYPLQPRELLVSPGMAEVEDDTTKPKIRRGVVVFIGNDVSPVYTGGTTIRFNYANAFPVYISGSWYNVITEPMVVSIEQD